MAGAAGVLVFVQNSQLDRVSAILQMMNAGERVSAEVMRLYCVRPTREATRTLCDSLKKQPELAHLENIDKLKPNNALRDLTAPWRLPAELCDNFHLIVGLETVSPELRSKYPHPNLTLQAGKIEAGETPMEAAVREVWEEAHFNCGYVYSPPVLLMSKGMHMFPFYITHATTLTYDQSTNSLFLDCPYSKVSGE